MANLSELDSLLKDLETAQFQIQNSRYSVASKMEHVF